jgi:protein-L-isoaspartate(D-aspartate) O-methyltransferase
MSDDQTFESLRNAMVSEQIARRGVHDPRVLRAMSAIPREQFVPKPFQSAAYDDRALRIEKDQTISQPYIVATMTEALRLQPEHRVLEIGTGSGYQTAVLAGLCHHVFTVERIAELSQSATERLDRLGIRNVSYRIGDGSAGWSDESPFDRVIVTAGSPRVPTPLVNQLTTDGIMVIPVGGESQQTLTWVKNQRSRFVEIPLFPCRFVKCLGNHAWP